MDKIGPTVQYADGHTELTANLFSCYQRALSCFLIAHKYKARIYDEDILTCNLNLSSNLRPNKIPEDAILPVEFVERLAAGYKTDSIPTLSVNNNCDILKEYYRILSKTDVQNLSKQNYRFGVLNVNKQLLKLELRDKLTEIVQDSWTPLFVDGAMIPLSYLTQDYTPWIDMLANAGLKILSYYDLREYAPPIQNPQLYQYTHSGSAVLSYEPFNLEMTIRVQLPRS